MVDDRLAAIGGDGETARLQHDGARIAGALLDRQVDRPARHGADDLARRGL
jgi:hypothetical protein